MNYFNRSEFVKAELSHLIVLPKGNVFYALMEDYISAVAVSHVVP